MRVLCSADRFAREIRRVHFSRLKSFLSLCPLCAPRLHRRAPARLAACPPTAAPNRPRRMNLLCIAAAVASLAAASGAALRDVRALRVDAGLRTTAGAAVPYTVCGIALTTYSNSDFVKAYDASRPKSLRVLGAGGFGTVYEMTMASTAARSQFENGVLANAVPPNTVAVKVLSPRKNAPEKTAASEKAAARPPLLAEANPSPSAGADPSLREAAVALMVCSAQNPCFESAPFVLAFLGMYTPDEVAISASRGPGYLVYEKGVGAELQKAMMSKVDPATKLSFNRFLAAHGATANAGALRNLDVALAVTRQLALGVARLQELGVTHRDIKPGNLIIGKTGIKLIDFGVACVGPGVDNVGPIKISSCADGAMKRLVCDPTQPAVGTPGFLSGPVLLKSLCEEGKGACSAVKLRSMDLFALGAFLVQLLTGSPSGFWVPDIPTNLRNTVSEFLGEQKIAKIHRRTSNAILSYFVALERESCIGLEEPEALAASRRRLFTFLAWRAAKNSQRGCLFCKPVPMMHFLTTDQKAYARTLRIPVIYRSIKNTPELLRSFGYAMQTGKKGPDEAFRMRFVVEAELNSAVEPEPWSADKQINENVLLPAPTQPALTALLDLLRKLIAWEPDQQGFANGDVNEVVTAMDAIRLTLHMNDGRALGKLARMKMHNGGCFKIAALALKQVNQRNLNHGDADSAPNTEDVMAAFHECVKSSPDGATNTKRSSAAIPGLIVEEERPRTMSQKSASNNAGGELPYRSISNTFEKLPFAKGNGGIWRARNFFFECDVINGGGVWVEWRKDEKFRGMGFIQQAYDQPPTAAQDLADSQVKRGKKVLYTCAKRRLSVVAGTKCKALQLLYATPRSKKKTATGAALLKLYPKTAASAAADYLTGLYDSIKEECSDHETLSKFRELTQAAADKRNKPDSPAAARKSSANEPPLLQGSF